MRALCLIATLATVPACLLAAEERPPQPQDAGAANGNVVAESRGPATRTTNAAARKALSITSATAQTFYCTQPDPRQDACYINVYYTSGTGSNSTDFGALHMSINGKIVFRAQGFFQQTLYTYNSFAGLGFRVQCGPPVNDPTDPASTKRKIGNSYNVELKWNGVGTSWDLADLMTVYCPPYNP